MSASLERNHRAVRVAGAVLAVLMISVVLANVLWPGPTSPAVVEQRMPPNLSPFPTFSLGPVLHAARMDANANLSMRLVMTSLQGIVNRVVVELYLDVRAGVAGNTSQMLSYLAARYNVTYYVMSAQAAIDAYARRAAGVVVYDPSRPESIDIGTVLTAQQNAVLAGPDLAGWLSSRYGLPILFDYAQRPDWRSLDAIGAYDRALRELYPRAYPDLLAILPPDRWAIRDYLVQTGTFVFYLTQGILASPMETAATMRILAAAPRGIPILGWFNSPTLTEENSFVQMASAAGKFVVGVQDVPNLSVLTALGRNETHRQVSPTAPPAPVLQDKTYVVLGIPDGDNLDFAAGRMWDLWSEPVRGTIPFAWSLNPLLVGLAPPLLDRYYDSATPFDRFLASPSGAGYLYPDYTGPGDLPSFVNFTKRYLDAADMDVVWLLNAFAASEITYTSASLSAYVDGDRPAGVVLDYDDQPRTRDAWMQAGTQAVAPVIRSTHFWTTADNVLGKIDTAIDSGSGGPTFLWITVYTFRFDLNDARALVGELSRRMAGNLEVVTPSAFFDLLRADFVRTARSRLDAMEGDPIASFLFSGMMESARLRLQAANVSLSAGDADHAAYVSYLALEDLRSVSSAEALLASLVVLLIDAYLARRPGRASEVLLGLAFGTAIGFLGGFDLPTFAVLSVLLVLPTLSVHGAPEDVTPGRRPSALIPGFVLALALTPLSVAYYYSIALRLELQGTALLTAAGALLVLGPTLAIVARRTHPRIDPMVSEVAGLALVVVFSGLVLLPHGAVPTVLALLALFASLSYAAIAALDRFAAKGGQLGRALATAILFLPLIVLFIRMPPIVFSLTTLRLPYVVESALYAPTVLIAAVALVLALGIGLRHGLRERVRKDYDREVHGGLEGP